MRRGILILMALGATTIFSLDLSAADRPVVAVFDVQIKFLELAKDKRNMLTDVVAEELALGGVYQVMPPGDVKRSLREKASESFQNCFDEACQIELGRQLSANKLLTTSIKKIGEKCRLTGSLYDLKRQTTDTTAKAVAGCEVEALVKSIEQVVSEIRAWGGGKEPAEEKGKIDKAEVRQPKTTLYWLRCPLGQHWTGEACAGKAKTFDWDGAMKACPSGYRLPSREEFVFLLDRCDSLVKKGGSGKCKSCAKSKKCRSLFGADSGWYWTSTSFTHSAWYVFFGNGNVFSFAKDRKDIVRCVRGRR